MEEWAAAATYSVKLSLPDGTYTRFPSRSGLLAMPLPQLFWTLRAHFLWYYLC